MATKRLKILMMAKKKTSNYRNPWASKKSRCPRKRAVVEGYRSGLEEEIAKQFESRELEAHYEEDVIEYQKKPSKYHPDFKLPNGVYIESKGRFLPADRTKHLLIKKQHPDIEIRFVFTNPNARLSKTSKTTYAQWCDQKGFKWAAKRIPEEWFNET